MFNAACIIFPLDSTVLEAGLLILTHLVIQQTCTECLLCDKPWAMGRNAAVNTVPALVKHVTRTVVLERLQKDTL